MKKNSTIQQGFTGSGSAKAEIRSDMVAMYVLSALIAGSLLGAFLASPSRDQKREAEQIKANYLALRENIARTESIPKDNWNCRQGAVDVSIQASQRMTSGTISFSSSSGYYESGPSVVQRINVVSEHTTMDCTREVKQYVEQSPSSGDRN